MGVCGQVVQLYKRVLIQTFSCKKTLDDFGCNTRMDSGQKNKRR